MITFRGESDVIDKIMSKCKMDDCVVPTCECKLCIKKRCRQDKCHAISDGKTASLFPIEECDYYKDYVDVMTGRYKLKAPGKI